MHHCLNNTRSIFPRFSSMRCAAGHLCVGKDNQYFFVNQQQELDSTLMRLGYRLASYPQFSTRVENIYDYFCTIRT